VSAEIETMNLRSAYFSDWTGRPTVLFWGNSKGLRDLRDFLRDSRWDSHALGEICDAVDQREITVLIGSSRRDTGMRMRHNGLEWRLLPDLAKDFAALLDGLASSSVAAHQYLDAYDNTITVEASLDEYPDSLRPGAFEK
jgi:hypothetical protein